MVDTLVDRNSSAEDPDYEYFREELNYNDEQVESAMEDAIEFFNERFGVDFSLSVPDAFERRFFQNSALITFRLPNRRHRKSLATKWHSWL